MDDARPGDGIQPIGQQVIHSITEGGDYITMLEAAGRPGGSWFNREKSTTSISITANYMLVGSQHFDAGPSVRRLSFSSSVVEHVLRLWASPDYKDIRHRRVGSTEYEIPILRKQVASYVDLAKRIRVRGGRADEIIPRSVFLLRAEHMPLDVFGDNSADDFDEDLDEDL